MRANRISQEISIPGGSTYTRANHLITEIGKRTHLIVTRNQLVALGLTDNMIISRLHAKFLTRVHRGVYSLSPPPLAPQARFLAAVLACGSDAVLSHQSAAILHGILDTPTPVTHVARLSGARQFPRGVRLHHPRQLADWERDLVDQVPVTSVSRTLADLAVSSSRRLLEDAISGARRTGQFDPAEIDRVVREAPGRPGGRKLLALVERWAPIEAPSLSPFQDRLFNLCEAAGIPRPEQEVAIGPYRVDFLWRRQRLILEADGRYHHESRFDEDRARDLYMASHGFQTIRVTYRMLQDDPQSVVTQIHQTLDHAEARLSGHLSPQTSPSPAALRVSPPAPTFS
jgi:hypothetical protein